MTVIMPYIQQTDGWLRKYVSFIALRQKYGAIKNGVSGSSLLRKRNLSIRHRLKPMLQDELQGGTAVELIYL
ncbi:hypothetical protein SAMN05216428_101406 [Nitrosospira sp. Nsp11]|nr:hypothetical protein SAMN05216428_101406 [Nitrosospira sp. Nsp11]